MALLFCIILLWGFIYWNKRECPVKKSWKHLVFFFLKENCKGNPDIINSGLLKRDLFCVLWCAKCSVVDMYLSGIDMLRHKRILICLSVMRSQEYSVLSADIPWETEEIWRTFAGYLLILHIPLSFGGLDAVAKVLQRSSLDPLTTVSDNFSFFYHFDTHLNSLFICFSPCWVAKQFEGTYIMHTYPVNTDCFHSHASTRGAYSGFGTVAVHCEASPSSLDLLLCQVFFQAELDKRICIMVRTFDVHGFYHISNRWKTDRSWGQHNQNTYITV